MTTDRKRAANRRNAQRSTGPRTSSGKARSSQNAQKHGLSAPVQAQTRYADLMQELEASLKAEGSEWDKSGGETLEVAEAVVDVLRARSFRAVFLQDLAERCSAQAESPSCRTQFTELLSYLVRLDRYERRALSRRKRAIQDFAAVPRSV